MRQLAFFLLTVAALTACVTEPPALDPKCYYPGDTTGVNITMDGTPNNIVVKCDWRLQEVKSCGVNVVRPVTTPWCVVGEKFNP